MHRAALFALPLALAGCSDGKDGTTIAINTSGADGNMVASLGGKDGGMSIKAPGFSGNIKLPKIQLDADDFDMNGVHLYPGSTISGMNVDAHDDGRRGDGDGTVKVQFGSPASPDTVRAWFLDKLNHAGFSVHDDGTGLSGLTDDRKPFSLDLAPDGGDHAKGTITIG